MRIYRNCNEAITDIGRELRKCSVEVHPQTMQNKDVSKDDKYITKEIQGFNICILDTRDKDFMPGVTLEWCREEFKERTSNVHVNPGEAYKLRPEVWNEFIVQKKTWKEPEEEGYDTDPFNRTSVFEYTYNERIYPQLKAIVNELRTHPETRQAIIEIHNNLLDLSSLGGVKRIPCSLSYQFMIRDNKLDIIYMMRSTDFATHFQNDIWLADELRKYIASMLNIEPGKFIMFASSLHTYKKDWDTLSKY